MILIFGGTTEGRHAAGVVDQAGHPFYYSTKEETQTLSLVHGIRLRGAMDTDTLLDFCRHHAVSLLIDAGHPFAVVLHQTVVSVAQELSIPLIRYNRIYPSLSHPSIVLCDDYEDAIQRLTKDNVQRLLALTGVNTIAPLKKYWTTHDCVFRVLDRPSSKALAQQAGYPLGQLVYYQPHKKEEELIQKVQPTAILTKLFNSNTAYGSSCLYF